jgi:hypothetical protein
VGAEWSLSRLFRSGHWYKLPPEAVIADGSSYPLPALMLSRGARHLTFVAGGRELAFLRGELQHKNLWVVDLRRTAERWFWNGCRSGRTWCYWIS